MILKTKTDIFNMALLSLGQTAAIMGADSDSHLTARVLRQWWDPALRDALAKTNWNCFTRVAPLSLISENFSNTWVYQYAFPANCQTIRRLSWDEFFPQENQRPDQKLPYQMNYAANNIVTILTNIPQAFAQFTARPVEGAGMPDYFAETVALILAEKAAPAIITNNWTRMKAEFLKDARNRISDLVAQDLDQQPAPRNPMGSFEASRQD